MACLCTDLLDDLELKFDLIIELANTILTKLRSKTQVQLLGGGGGYYERLRDWDEYDRIPREDNIEEIMDLIAIIMGLSE